MRGAETYLERVPLPGVLLDPNWPYHVRALRRCSPQGVGGAVAAAVVNGNKLVAETALIKACGDNIQVRLDRVAETIYRQYDAQEILAEDLPNA